MATIDRFTPSLSWRQGFFISIGQEQIVGVNAYENQLQE
jgi:hypothetical protein